jgi:PKD repeat protein
MPVADATNGVAPLRVSFIANATDPDGAIRDYQWTFDDGTFSTNANPVKIFASPGNYTARLTVTDNSGNTVTRNIGVVVSAVALGSPSYSNEKFRFAVFGSTNYQYVVQCSDELSYWAPVATNRGPFTFEETAAEPWRFYRALVRP